MLLPHAPNHEDPDMERARKRAGAAPDIGQHVATLNLFRESDGTFWLTVASAPAAVEEAKRLNNGTTPMQVMSGWLQQATANFLNSWGACKSSMAARQLPKPKKT